MTSFRTRLVSGLLAALLLAASARPGVSEYELKAALIYKISKFVRWPAADKPGAPFRVCVVGRDYFGPALDALKGQAVQGQPIAVARLDAGELASATCQVLFISRSENDQLVALLKATDGRPVLTISDIEGFAARGGIVEFATRNKKLGFRINPDAGRRAGLELSAQLLQLATVVRTGGAAP